MDALLSGFWVPTLDKQSGMHLANGIYDPGSSECPSHLSCHGMYYQKFFLMNRLVDIFSVLKQKGGLDRLYIKEVDKQRIHNLEAEKLLYDRPQQRRANENKHSTKASGHIELDPVGEEGA